MGCVPAHGRGVFSTFLHVLFLDLVFLMWSLQRPMSSPLLLSDLIVWWFEKEWPRKLIREWHYLKRIRRCGFVKEVVTRSGELEGFKSLTPGPVSVS